MWKRYWWRWIGYKKLNLSKENLICHHFYFLDYRHEQLKFHVLLIIAIFFQDCCHCLYGLAQIEIRIRSMIKPEPILLYFSKFITKSEVLKPTMVKFQLFAFLAPYRLAIHAFTSKFLKYSNNPLDLGQTSNCTTDPIKYKWTNIYSNFYIHYKMILIS